MSIPDYQSLMLPLLRYAGDGEEHSFRETLDFLGKQFDLTEKEFAELLPSRRETVFGSRLRWSRTYLSKASLLESNRRGFFKITPKGAATLKQKPKSIDKRFLEQFQDFRTWLGIRRQKASGPGSDAAEQLGTPEEALESVHASLRGMLAAELLEHIERMHHTRFEQMVVDLLLKMGYGGNGKQAARVFKKTKDEEIDGMISGDRLGLELICLQARRREETVGKSEVQKFVGSLNGRELKKGVFITTSDFTREAVEYINQLNIRVVLIDGEDLAQYLIDYDLGVSTVAAYQVKRLDSEYFGEL